MKTSDELMEQLSAYLDDELSPPARAAVESRLAHDAEARRAIARLRQASEAVRTLPRESPPADMLDAIQSRLARRQLLGDGAPAADGAVRRLGWLRPATMAAALLLAAGASWRIWFAPRPPMLAPTDHGATSALPLAAPAGQANSSERESARVATRERKRDDARVALSSPRIAHPDAAASESTPDARTMLQSLESSDGVDKERSLALGADSDDKFAAAANEKSSSVALHAAESAMSAADSAARFGADAAEAAPRSAPPPTPTNGNVPSAAPPTPTPPQPVAEPSPVKRPMFNPAGEWVTFMMLLCPSEDSASQACRRMLAFNQPGLTVQSVIIAFAGMGSEGTTISLRGSPDLLADALFAAQGEIDPGTGRHECTFRLKAGERQFTRDGLREWLRPRKAPTTTAAAAATAPSTQPDPEGLVVVRVVRRPTATATAPSEARGGSNGR